MCCFQPLNLWLFATAVIEVEYVLEHCRFPAPLLPFGPILTSSYLIMVFACLHAFFLHYGLSLRPEEENILLFKDSGDYDV